MRISPSSYFLIFLLAIMAVAIGISLTFTAWESKMLPLLVASFVFILSAIQLGKELSTKKKNTGVTDEEPPEGRGTGLVSSLGWLLGFPLAIYLFGFLVAIPIFIFGYIKLRGRSWIAAISVAVITTIIVYCIFELGFKSDLWKGIYFE